MKTPIRRIKVSHMLNVSHINTYSVRITRGYPSGDFTSEYYVRVTSPSIGRLEKVLREYRPTHFTGYFSVYPEFIYWYD